MRSFPAGRLLSRHISLQPPAQPRDCHGLDVQAIVSFRYIIATCIKIYSSIGRTRSRSGCLL